MIWKKFIKTFAVYPSSGGWEEVHGMMKLKVTLPEGWMFHGRGTFYCAPKEFDMDIAIRQLKDGVLKYAK